MNTMYVLVNARRIQGHRDIRMQSETTFDRAVGSTIGVSAERA